LSHAYEMPGTLDDDFVRADASHQVVDAIAALVQVSFDGKGREFVGHDAHAPTSRIRRQGFAAKREYLRRRRGLAALAQGAHAGVRLRLRVAAEVGGALRAFVCNDHPTTDNRVLA